MARLALDPTYCINISIFKASTKVSQICLCMFGQWWYQKSIRPKDFKIFELTIKTRTYWDMGTQILWQSVPMSQYVLVLMVEIINVSLRRCESWVHLWVSLSCIGDFAAILQLKSHSGVGLCENQKVAWVWSEVCTCSNIVGHGYKKSSRQSYEMNQSWTCFSQAFVP